MDQTLNSAPICASDDLSDHTGEARQRPNCNAQVVLVHAAFCALHSKYSSTLSSVFVLPSESHILHVLRLRLGAGSNRQPCTICTLLSGFRHLELHVAIRLRRLILPSFLRNAAHVPNCRCRPFLTKRGSVPCQSEHQRHRSMAPVKSPCGPICASAHADL